jgi:hypothetical protein
MQKNGIGLFAKSLQYYAVLLKTDAGKKTSLQMHSFHEAEFVFTFSQ